MRCCLSHKQLSQRSKMQAQTQPALYVSGCNAATWQSHCCSCGFCAGRRCEADLPPGLLSKTLSASDQSLCALASLRAADSTTRQLFVGCRHLLLLTADTGSGVTHRPHQGFCRRRCLCQSRRRPLRPRSEMLTQRHHSLGGGQTLAAADCWKRLSRDAGGSPGLLSKMLSVSSSCSSSSSEACVSCCCCCCCCWLLAALLLGGLTMDCRIASRLSAGTRASSALGSSPSASACTDKQHFSLDASLAASRAAGQVRTAEQPERLSTGTRASSALGSRPSAAACAEKPHSSLDVSSAK